MVRLYPEHARFIVTLLMECQEKWPELFNITGGATPTGEYPTGKELLEVLTAQLDRQSSEKDLIDTVVSVLGLPFVENRVASASLRNLRKALLLPDEAKAWQQATNDAWYCPGCGASFFSGDLVTLQKSDHGQRVLCVNCHPPQAVTCENGKHHLSVTKRLQKALEDTKKCDSCKAEAEKAAEKKNPSLAGAATVGTVTGRMWTDMFVGGGRGGDRAGGRVPPAPPTFPVTIREGIPEPYVNVPTPPVGRQINWQTRRFLGEDAAVAAPQAPQVLENEAAYNQQEQAAARARVAAGTRDLVAIRGDNPYETLRRQVLADMTQTVTGTALPRHDDMDVDIEDDVDDYDGDPR